MQRLLTSHLLTFSLAGLGHLATSTEIRETETKSSLAERPNPQRKLKGPITRKEGTASSQSLRGPRTKCGLDLWWEEARCLQGGDTQRAERRSTELFTTCWVGDRTCTRKYPGMVQRTLCFWSPRFHSQLCA